MPIPQNEIPLRFTGHERDTYESGGAVDDMDYMHARFYKPFLARFLSVDPVLNQKRATKVPQNWNRYAYALGNPLKYVDPRGEDVSIKIHFKDAGLSEDQKTAIIAQVKAWYEAQNIGTAHVFDGALASHAGTVVSRAFSSGFATITVSGASSTKHTPGTVFAGSLKHLPPAQFLRAVSNAIAHETAVHRFGMTPVILGDNSAFDRKGNYMNMPWNDPRGWRQVLESRKGTVADSEAFGDPETQELVTGGPIPVHPDDASKMIRELGPLRIGPPDLE